MSHIAPTPCKVINVLLFCFLFTALISCTPQPKTFEQEANAWASPERDVWQKPDVVLKQLGNLKGKTILDLGAGSSYFTLKLAQTADTVIAADTSIIALDLLQQKMTKQNIKNIKILKSVTGAGNLPAHCADVVLMVDVYDQLSSPVLFCARLHKVLKYSGELFVIQKRDTYKPIILSELARAGFRSFEVDSVSLPRQYIIRAE